jgi:Fe-S-cluster containining protein
VEDKTARLLALRARIPDGFTCKPGCPGCCGIELHSITEQDRIDASGGVKVSTGLCDCPYLRDGGCSVHDERPIYCRLYGNTPVLRCHYGGVPSRMLTIEETEEILEEYESIVHDEPVVSTIGQFVDLT